MDFAQFAALHVPALETDEARFSLHIAGLTSAEKEGPLGLRLWSLGAPGHCAMQWPGRAILLGNLDRAECQQLAEATMAIGAPGVVGADATAHWFVEHAMAVWTVDDAPGAMAAITRRLRRTGAVSCV